MKTAFEPLCALSLALGCALELSPAWGQTPTPPPSLAAVVIGVQGSVEVMAAGRSTWVPVAPAQVLGVGDQVRTLPRSRALLQLEGQGTIRLRDSSQLAFRPPRQPKARPIIEVLRGFFHFFNREKAIEVEIQNRLVSAGTRGTEFQVAATEDQPFEVFVFEGAVDLETSRGKITVNSGQHGRARPGELPTSEELVQPENVIQWCLHYPAVLDAEELTLSDPERTALDTSLAAYRSGDLLEALAAYPEQRAPESDAERVYLAALLLAVGDVAEAWTVLGTTAAASPQGQSLLQLTAAVKGQDWTRAAPPRLASEWLAESYYQQSQASRRPEALRQALESARNAVAQSPCCGLAWSRLAELEFGFGHTDAAHRALDEALRLAPENARSLALRGFVLSAENRIPSAVAEFDRAIQLDSALANAWLGRGLCRIRRGEAAAGRSDLLVAAALEPRRAVLRSYLGKAYSDAGDRRHATKELALALELDPKDPTGWLYAALDKHQKNRVNEAIRDLERSKAENDNRSVYRSDLLLDQDRAVRSANLARIYQDAGMPEVAYREAVQAVASDYGNYSAHLFLANSYDQLRDPQLVNLRYETAANTEYLLANLLAPVGAGTLSPAVSLQEYSKLFERDRFGLNSLTEYRSSGDWHEHGAQYGTSGNSGYSLEATYRSENGQRPNNDLEHLQVSLTLKQQLTPADTLLLLGSYLELDGGDLAPYYDPAWANRTFRSQEKQEPLVALGYRHEWRPGTQTLFLASAVRDRLEYGTTDSSFPTFVFSRQESGEIDAALPVTAVEDYRNQLDVVSVEGQQLWRHSDRHHTTLGARLQWGQLEPTSSQESFVPEIYPLPSPYQESHDGEIDRQSVYGYHRWEVFDRFHLEAGLSYDRVHFPSNFLYPPLSDQEDTRDQVSPKAGLIWSPLRDSTVRVGYTRSLSGASLDQSLRLEPTQVGGFTQAYRGLIPESITGPSAGAEFETIGLAFEQKFKTGTYLGVVAERLDSDVRRRVGAYELLAFSPDPGAPSGLTQAFDFREQSLGVMLNQLIGEALAVGVAYRLTHAELANDFTEVPEYPPDVVELFGFNPHERTESDLHQLTFSAVLNVSAGLFVQGAAAWFQQSNQGYLTDHPGDDLWQIDAFVGYRFPRRQAEVTIGVLNLTDQDYRLDPLTSPRELRRERTLVARLRLSF